MRKKTEKINNHFELISEKMKTQKSTSKIFIGSFFAVFIFEIFLRFFLEANKVIDFIDSILLNVIAGYIIFFISVVYPDKKRYRANQKYANYLMDKTANNLNQLMTYTLRDDQWQEKDDQTLMINFTKTVKDYNLATDVYSFKYTNDENICYYRPCRLTVISIELTRLLNNIQEIERYGSFFPQGYIAVINDLNKSEALKQFSLFKNCEIIDTSMIKKGNLLYETFQQDIPWVIFQKMYGENEIFITIVRKIINYKS